MKYLLYLLLVGGCWGQTLPMSAPKIPCHLRGGKTELRAADADYGDCLYNGMTFDEWDYFEYGKPDWVFQSSKELDAFGIDNPTVNFKCRLKLTGAWWCNRLPDTPKLPSDVAPNAVQTPDVGVDCTIQRDGSYRCHSKSGEDWIISGVGPQHNTAKPEPIDVPAVQGCYFPEGVISECLGKLEWVCRDRTRILQHDEQQPPTYWCHKPQP